MTQPPVKDRPRAEIHDLEPAGTATAQYIRRANSNGFHKWLAASHFGSLRDVGGWLGVLPGNDMLCRMTCIPCRSIDRQRSGVGYGPLLGGRATRRGGGRRDRVRQPIPPGADR